MEKILSYIPQLLPYLSVTFEYVGLSLLFGTVLALILLAMKLCRFRVVRAVAYGYTTVMRCTPSVILLFIVFYGLPSLLQSWLGVNIQNADAVLFVVATFTLFLGGSVSEVIRAAYLSIDHGQCEAALCVGLSKRQAILRIVAPQAFYLMLPNLCNTLQFLLKEGSLGYIIGLVDITGKAFLLNSNTMSAYVLQIYLALSLIYWPLSIAIEQGFKALERRFSYEAAPVRAVDEPAAEAEAIPARFAKSGEAA
jgi:L-cystine transport system permease protein